MSETERGASPMEGLCQQLAALTQAVKDLQQGYHQLDDRIKAMNPQPVSQPMPSTDPRRGTATTTASTVVLPPPEPRVPLPERFSGERHKFRSFRNACKLYFALQPRTFSLEATKVGFVISLLLGEPQSWAHHMLEQDNPSLSSSTSFFEAMALIYDDPERTSTAEATLHLLQQGRRPAEDYVAEFRKWSADTNWNDPALRHQFRMGLSEALKDELARVGVPDSLEDLIRLAIQIDRRLRERKSERATTSTRPTWMLPRVPPAPRPSTTPHPSPLPDPEPMQLGLVKTPLSSEERSYRRQNNLCLYCGAPGHFLRTCPVRPSKYMQVPIPETLCAATRLTHVTLALSMQVSGKTIPIQAIIDSGACSCFMDATFAQLHHIPLRPKAQKMTIHLADGSHPKSGPIVLETIPLLTLSTTGHQEFLRCDIIPSPTFPLILGIPWLQAHCPFIDWHNGTVTFNSIYCQQHCLPNSSPQESTLLGIDTDPALGQLVPLEYHDFLDVFDKKGVNTLPPHRSYDCPIELLPGAEIPFGRIFPLSEPELETLRIYIKENLAKGFIRPSTSPAGAGIFFVENKDHSLRPCVDYRALNNITIKNRYPLPLVPELFQRFRSARVFSKLDLRGAYNLVRIREGDEWKTAFRSRFGHFEYVVMPFGLCNAPATFQHFVNDIFRDFLDLFMIVYLDDILIFSSSEVLHREHVKQVLLRLRQHHLYVKAEKCEFHKESIHFLGFIISTSGISMDPQKVSAIRNWPSPTTKKGVQRFVGFANFYRKFIRNFSTIISPITSLTKLALKFHWSPEAQQAFEKLKDLFSSAPILCHPNPSLPYVLEVDASEVAIGAILSQRMGPKSLMHPVAFFSRKLTPSEKNYDVGDRELLAIKSALEEWRYLLEGASHPFLIFTDHKNLEYLRTAKRLRPRQARWALFFSRFLFHITYRPGSKNGKPDALSRMFSEEATIVPPDTILPAHSFLMLHDGLLEQIRRLSVAELPTDIVLRERDGLFFQGDKLFVPRPLRTRVLGLCHDHPLAGHFGVRKTTDLLLRTFWWPELRADCRAYVLACPICTRCKVPKSKAWGLLRPLPVPSKPWEMVCMDFIVELPPSKGLTCIYVVVDRFTKMAHFVPLPAIPSAMETAEVFIREVVRLHGVPASVTSDRGVQFTSKFWRALCSSLQIEVCLSSAYHPQSNGQTERTNQTLEQYLRCFSSFTQDDWASLLPLAEFAYNNAVHSSTGLAPFFANFGFCPSFLPAMPSDSDVPAVRDRMDSLRAASDVLRDALAKAQGDAKRFHDRKRRGDLVLAPGDMVWLSSAHLRMDCPSRKLAPRFLGPFPVSRVVNPVAYELKLPARLRVHPVFHVSLLRPVVEDPFPARVSAPPPPVSVSGCDEFEVEAILDCRQRGGVTQYLVKWRGYGPEDNSWEPDSNVHAPELLRGFWRDHPRRRGRVGSRRLPVGGGLCQDSPRAVPVRMRARSRARSRGHARAPAVTCAPPCWPLIGGKRAVFKEARPEGKCCLVISFSWFLIDLFLIPFLLPDIDYLCMNSAC